MNKSDCHSNHCKIDSYYEFDRNNYYKLVGAFATDSKVVANECVYEHNSG